MVARRLAWSDTIFDSATLAGSTEEKFDLLANAAASDTLTVERIILDFLYFQGPTNEVEGFGQVTCGIGVTSIEAFDAGILPNPSVASEFPARGWLYRAAQPALQAIPTGGTPTAMWRLAAHFKADIRAKRKVDKGKLYLVVENTTFSGATTLFRVGIVRVLCRT